MISVPKFNTSHFCYLIINNLLLFLSVSTRVVIGEFSGPHFSVPPAKFKLKLFLSRAPD